MRKWLRKNLSFGGRLANYSSECYVLLLLDVGVVYQWDSARLLTDPSQEVTAAVVRGSRSESM